MCGRYSNRFTWKELHDLYNIHFADTDGDWQPKYNIAPTTQIPVVRSGKGVRRLDMMRWGLVPSWAKKVEKFATFNARSDGCTTKPTYRGAWKSGQRCIIPASSFFEWRKADKQPHAIALGNKGPMSFAGLWDVATTDGGMSISCTMITTDGNSLMQPIHDRMPVIIGDEDLPKWLGEEAAAEEELKALLQPFPPERMTAWAVSKEVGQVMNQGAKLIEPV